MCEWSKNMAPQAVESRNQSRLVTGDKESNEHQQRVSADMKWDSQLKKFYSQT